ncbi:hypothetical protein BMT54_01165 [Pasteurellaceae bacterium 15-036681]|nr:hypothetical protein BMT54_01165 [Pasteurellaceae bacterium 15-036681]
MSNTFSTNFLNDIKNHKITVIENSEHSKIFKAMRADGSICQSFTVIYADNKAIITGDMGHYVFGRLQNSYGFFLNNESAFNFGYVLEKLLAEDKFNKAERYDSTQAEETIKSIIQEYRESLDEDDCQDDLNELEDSLEHIDFDSEIEVAAWLYSLTDESAEIFEEYNIDDFTVLDYRFIWCVYGLIWATREFEKAVNNE